MSRLGSIYYRQMWRYLQAPKNLDRHFVAVDWARIIFSPPGLAVKVPCAFLRFRHSQFWLGSPFGP